MTDGLSNPRRAHLTSLLLSYESNVIALYDLQRADADPEDFLDIDVKASVIKRREAIARLRAEILSLSDWQPIETAPKDGTHVLLLVPDYDYGQDPKVPYSYVIEGWWREKAWPAHEWEVAVLPSHGCDCCAFENQAPTHWMPLPDAPKEKDQ